MKNFSLKTVFFFCLTVYFPLQSMGWGMNGHHISGEIADSYVTIKTRASIKAILGNESIAMASNWADFIKSDSTYNYLSSWHYIDFDRPFSYPELQLFLTTDTSTNAYTKLQFLVSELKNKNLLKSKKEMYLRLLIHIVEDVHQPMHTAHTSDKGGNGFKVVWFGQNTNLHSVWDTQLIEYQQLSYTESAKAINFTTPHQRSIWKKEPISKWIFDSKEIAETLYTDIQPNDKLGYRYNFDHIAILNMQLLKGGVHLASLLNQIFG